MTTAGGAGAAPSSASAVGLLFVCTGNICRSPAAERLARRQLEDALGDEAAQLFRVESAGTRPVVGAPIHPHTAAAVRAHGGETAGFVARRLTASMMQAADLVLTMNREHRRLALELCPSALSRTFTLREAVALSGLLDPGAGAATGARGPASSSDGVSFARRLAGARAMRRVSDDDDVVDPVNAPPEVHREVTDLISAGLRVVLPGLILDVRRRDAQPWSARSD